jgi:signal transduction histidine kinase
MTTDTSQPSPAADQVDTSLFRALAVLRVVVLAYAVVLNAARWHEFARPALGWVVVGGMCVWSAFATWAYDAPRRRRLPLFVADAAVALLALLSTPLVESQAMLDRHASTVPSFWVMSAVLAWAIWRGWVAGLAVAVLLSAADLSVRTDYNGTTWGNIFLLLLAAGVVGYTAPQLREAVEARARAERVAATMAERARLARVVHDGVLQVLALVQRRGLEIGGDAADLGRMAGDQEVALRSLVQGDAAVRHPDGHLGADETGDLVDVLGSCQSRAVTVSGPGRPVRLPRAVVDELAAVVRACLDNVARHVGAGAPAWVLVEDLGASVVVTVRDEGPGIVDGRLDEARGEGRLGVAESIRGRMADLGGAAALMTAPGQGTEWELRVPRRAGA